MRLLNQKAIVTGAGTGIGAGIALELAREGADVLINVNWGRDAVLSTQQAKQFGLLPKIKVASESIVDLEKYVSRVSLGLTPYHAPRIVAFVSFL